MAVAKKLEGVDKVKCFTDFTNTGKCKYRKPTLAELKARQALSERLHSASTEIRARAGLDAMPLSFWRTALDAEIAQRGAAPAKRKPSVPSVERVREMAAAHGFALVAV